MHTLSHPFEMTQSTSYHNLSQRNLQSDWFKGSWTMTQENTFPRHKIFQKARRILVLSYTSKKAHVHGSDFSKIPKISRTVWISFLKIGLFTFLILYLSNFMQKNEKKADEPIKISFAI